MQTARWSARTKLTIILLLLAFFIYLLYRFSVVISPFILAVIIAFILSPVATWFQERLHMGRGLATILAYLVLLVFLIAIPMIIIPPLAAQSAALNLDLQNLIQELEKQLEAVLGNQYIIAGQTIDVKATFEQVIGSVQQIVEPIAAQTFTFLIEFISSLVWVVFILVVSFYLVKDAEALQSWMENLVPPGYRMDFLYLRKEINLIWSAFFRGQLVLASIVAAIFTVVGLIIGMPFALTMGVLAGLLEFLPSIGHAIWLTLGATLAFFIGSTWINIPNWAFALLLIGLHIFFQQFDINYLIPRIIGRRVHLPPLVVILGIVSGAVLAGVLGVLLAAPTIASARVIGRYVYAKLFDQEPFPTPVAAALPPPNPRWWRQAFGERDAKMKEEGKDD